MQFYIYFLYLLIFLYCFTFVLGIPQIYPDFQSLLAHILRLAHSC